MKTDEIEIAQAPLKVGERVFIRNITMGGRIIIEGEAVIVRPSSDLPGNTQFKVRFRGERMAYTRSVLPEHRRREPV